MNTRLDIWLVCNKGLRSRSQSKDFITRGLVSVNGVTATKASYRVKGDDVVTIKNKGMYVSRSARKLLHALDIWDICLDKATCLDIGSSTGGFTEVLLNHRARIVYAVDVGVDQLHDSLRNDTRVVVCENTDIRDVQFNDISFDIIVIDVSFISLTHIIPLLSLFLAEKGTVIALLKPQFEVGKDFVKKGIVKDKARVEEVKKKIVTLFMQEGFDVKPLAKSPIKGKEGNQEYLLYAQKQ
ncbi:TlyA family rRNA (cytidine-2'-O)-methyltransferase [Candidatus Peregrinibacteria bacterium]|nr:TlyA family rRNA (cytidine-2'-O)-methyltransferase [Candidatus Peregrinibacteria bacterium]